MTQYRLWVIAIAAAIIVPLMVGFCWPSDDTSEPIWNADDRYFDVYENLAVTDVPNTTQYSGANNNMFLFGSGIYDSWEVVGNKYTNAVTPYPRYNVANELGVASSDLPYAVHASTDSATMYGVGASIDPAPNSATMYVFNGHNALQFYDEDGNEYQFLMIYSNMRTVLLNIDTGEMMDATDVTFYYTHQSASPSAAVTPCRFMDQYIDPSGGFNVHAMSDRYVWMNGYENHGMTLLVNGSQWNDWYHNFGSFFFEGENGESSLRIYNDNSTLRVRFESDGEVQNYPLGDASVYEYVLVVADTDSKSIIVYGLIGMEDFTSNYIDKLGNSVRFDYFDQGTFRSVEMLGVFDYYVSSTSVESGTVKAMVDGLLTPKSFYGDNDWMVILNAPSVMGPSLTFVTDGGLTHKYDVDGGYIELPIGTGGADVDVSVRELRIEHYIQDGTTYTLVNGVQMPYNIEGIYFEDLWVLGLPTYHLTLEQHQEYQWTVGTFNLDYKGFCMVGILTMFLMFCLFGLMYRRTEGDTGASGMVTSIVIGIIYLILLMNYT